MIAIADIAYPRSPTLDVHDLVTGERSSLVADLDAVTDDVDPLRGAWVSSLSFSPDSRLLAAANHRGAALIWDTSTMEPVGEPLSRGGGEVLDLEFGGSSDVIVVTSGSNDITMLDVTSRNPIAPAMQSPSGLSIGLATSPDGTMLLSGGSDGIQLWDVAGGTAIGRPYPVPTPLGPPMQWLDGPGSADDVVRRGDRSRRRDLDNRSELSGARTCASSPAVRSPTTNGSASAPTPRPRAAEFGPTCVQNSVSTPRPPRMRTRGAGSGLIQCRVMDGMGTTSGSGVEVRESLRWRCR